MEGPRIYIGYDKAASLVFRFTGEFLGAGGLLAFDYITVTIGDEQYSTVDDPTVITVLDEGRLRIAIGDVTALPVGDYHPTVVGFNATYDNGYPLLVRGNGGKSRIHTLSIEEI